MTAAFGTPTPSPADASAPFAISTTGAPALSAPLGEALQAQWRLGFPRTPDGVDQLTNGFFRYPAALQPMAARHLMSIVPDGPLLDPFCGSGTALIEALRAGRDAIGADASPLAVWVARRHTWRPTPPQCDRLRGLAAAAAEEAVGAASFDGVRAALERRVAADAGNDEDVAEAAWFCYCVAAQRAKTQRKLAKQPAGTLRAVANEYAHCAARLAGAAPPGGASVRLVSSDARELSLPARVAAIVTSPPYPGVYDYLSMAREERAARGDAPVMGLARVPEADAPGARQQWPADWQSRREIGARKARKRRPGAFNVAWAADQRAWLGASLGCLAPGGRAALLIGDGDGIDNLAATRAAAADVGFELLATATIAATVERTARQKGQRRTEHAVLLEAPGD